MRTYRKNGNASCTEEKTYETVHSLCMGGQFPYLERWEPSAAPYKGTIYPVLPAAYELPSNALNSNDKGD